MAVKVPYTSTIDRVLILPKIIASFSIFGLILWAFISILEFFNIPKGLKIGEVFNVILFFLLMFISFVISIYIYSKTAGRLFSNLSAFFYIRSNLKTKISWADVSAVSFLFIPNQTGKWYPMNEVLLLDEEMRIDYIKTFADKILETTVEAK